MILDDISESLVSGKSKETQTLVRQAIESGVPPQSILKDGLERGLGIIGKRFERKEAFVPEIMSAVRTMNICARMLAPLMTENDPDSDSDTETLHVELREHNRNLADIILNSEKAGTAKCSCARCRTKTDADA